MVARLPGGQEVAGSNPVAPTTAPLECEATDSTQYVQLSAYVAHDLNERTDDGAEHEGSDAKRHGDDEEP